MTDAELRELRPAAEVHPALVIAKRNDGFLRSKATDVAVSLRLDRDIVEKLQSSGPGWQTRANEILRKALAR